MILWLKKFGIEKVDQKSKFDFFWTVEFSSNDSESVWWSIMDFGMFWTKKLGQYVELMMLRSISKQIGHSLSRKSMITIFDQNPN